ncbi:MAG: MxaK protein [Methylohalobius sp.]|nr:MxaK protein [Methylohalobius sp.]
MIWEGVQAYRAIRHNQALATIDRLQPQEDTAPELLAAKANRHAQEGKWELATRCYVQALSRAEGQLKQKLHYNLGTLYLREAAKLWNQQGVWAYSHVVTLLGLAREHLRESVRLDPDDLEARYNLEYALRITPPPREREPAKWQGTKSSVFSIMPGSPQGGP